MPQSSSHTPDVFKFIQSSKGYLSQKAPVADRIQRPQDDDNDNANEDKTSVTYRHGGPIEAAGSQCQAKSFATSMPNKVESTRASRQSINISKLKKDAKKRITRNNIQKHV